MGQKQNLDTDPDYIMLQHQGDRIPVPTRIAVDDGENIMGGVMTGGGTASAGNTGGSTLSAQQNFSQIQENPPPACVAHGTILDVWRNSAEIIRIPVEDMHRKQCLRYDQQQNQVDDIDRKWCESLWMLQSGNSFLECSPSHRVITSLEDLDGTAVTELRGGDKVLMSGGIGTLTESKDTGRPGWVYKITLVDDGTPQSHWFMSGNFCSHNAKREDL